MRILPNIVVCNHFPFPIKQWNKFHSKPDLQFWRKCFFLLKSSWTFASELMISVPPSQRKCSLCCTFGLSSLPLNPAHPSFQVVFPNYHHAGSGLNKNQTSLPSSLEQGDILSASTNARLSLWCICLNFTRPGKFRYGISVLHYAKSPQIPDNRIFTISPIMWSKNILLQGRWNRFIFPWELINWKKKFYSKICMI